MYKLYIEDFEKNSPRNKKLVFIDFQYLNSVDDNNKTLIAEVKFITEEIEFLIYKNGGSIWKKRKKIRKFRTLDR